MKRLVLISSFLAGMMIASYMAPGHTQGMKGYEPAPTFQTEGRDPVEYNVSCTSTAWTVFATSDTIARSTLVEAPAGNAATVCVQVATAAPAAVSCSTSTVGMELPAGSALTTYSKAYIYCETASGNNPQDLKGSRNRDRGDYGQITSGNQ